MSQLTTLKYRVRCKYTGRPKKPSISNLITETKEQLEALHNELIKWDDMEKHWMCTCPICRSLELGEEPEEDSSCTK